MKQSSTKHSPRKAGRRHGTVRATLAAIGFKLRQMHLWQPIRDRVQIAQKTVKHTPIQKLMDGWIAILAGAQGLVEINRRVRNDPGVQAAFGREGCAEQSVVQETLDRCTAGNVMQMQEAMDCIYREHSRGYRHDYQAGWQLLDVDISGLPCGKKAAFATKGYFAHQRNRRGRQLGRVVASGYREVVVDRLYPGTTQLNGAFQELVMAAEATLALEETQRARTILRMDSGGGTLADVNWALQRRYQVHCKDYSGRRAEKLAETVTTWSDDPSASGRQAGWVQDAPSEYATPVVRVAVRCPTTRKGNTPWRVGVLLSTLSPAEVIALTGQPAHQVHDPEAVLWAYVTFYDLRGGGAETLLKDDKQGLGLTGRNKKRFAAQQMLVQLCTLAHNALVWMQSKVAAHCPPVAPYGMLRWVRDVLPIRGWVVCDHEDQLSEIWLNPMDRLAQTLLPGLRHLLQPEQVAVNLGET